MVDNLTPLKRISPSQYTSIKNCPYRAVLANSCTNPMLPYPAASHLGNVIHECINLIVTNKIKTEEEFNENWARLIANKEIEIEEAGFGYLIPLRENVHGYTIKKLQVKSMIHRRKKVTTQGARNKNIRILSEEWLESTDSLIGGKADIIYHMNNYAKLSDYKSGKILNDKGEIKKEYENQLKLYAYLHKEKFNKYPDKLSIIGVDKEEHSIEFKPEECEALAKKSRELLAKINGLVKKDNRDTLAKPNIDYCTSCLYRPTCEFYWKLPLANTDSIFTDVKGTLKSVRPFRNGNVNTTLIFNDNKITVTHINGEHFSLLNSLIGGKVAFYNVKKEEHPGQYKFIKTTKIYDAQN